MATITFAADSTNNGSDIMRNDFCADVFFSGTGLRTPLQGTAGRAVLTAIAAGAVAPGVAIEDCDSPDQVVTFAAEHLAHLCGVEAQRVGVVFERITNQLMPGTVPKGIALLSDFVSGPLSWPRRVLVNQSISDPLTLLETEDFTRLPARLAATGALTDARTPLYTRKELRLVLQAFASHIDRNAEALVRTGHPATLFAQCPWLDVRLNKLYPNKIPVVSTAWVDSPRWAYAERYVERRRIALPLSHQEIHRRGSSSCGILELQTVVHTPTAAPAWGQWGGSKFVECSYDCASNLPELHDDDVEWLGVIRPPVQQVKVQVITALAEALFTGKYAGLWEKVINVIATHLNLDQVTRLFRLDAKYQTYTALADRGTCEPLPCMPGGLSAVLELVGHVEKELAVGTLHRTRNALGDLVASDLLGRPRLRVSGHDEPYFELAAGIDGRKWRAILDEYLDIEVEEPGFWTAFRTRLAESISTHVPQLVTIPVKPKYRDFIEPAVINHVHNFSRELDNGVLSPDTLRPSSERKPIARFPSISGLTWSQVSITFVSNDSVTIAACGQTRKFTFAEMGFTDGRRGDRPDGVWELLHIMAKSGGQLSASSGRQASTKFSNNAPAYITKIRKRLRRLLPIEGDPFENYKYAKGYKPKFQLLTKAHNSDDAHSTDD